MDQFLPCHIKDAQTLVFMTFHMSVVTVVVLGRGPHSLTAHVHSEYACFNLLHTHPHRLLIPLMW